MKVYQHLARRIQALITCQEEENTHWILTHKDEIGRLVKTYMPSGSGFDNGTNISLDDSNADRLVFKTSFHHMDSHGGYDGWTEHTVIVRPDFDGGVRLTVKGVNRNDIKEYISDCFWTAMNEEV